MSDDFCGLINSTTGPFTTCTADPEVSADRHKSNCIYDVCANQNDPELAQEASCNSLSALATECANFGHTGILWREEANCRKY